MGKRPYNSIRGCLYTELYPFRLWCCPVVGDAPLSKDADCGYTAGMQKHLCNDYLSVTVDTAGAELVSVKTRSHREILWQGEKSVWNAHAPLLFPWTGRIKNRRFTHKGAAFDAGIHGFIAQTEHRLAQESADLLRFETESSASTHKLFPYDFALAQTFSLSASALTHTVDVTNTGKSPMFFGLGFHPGFICPFEKEKEAGDYELVFDTAQSPDLVELTENGLPSGAQRRYMNNQKALALSDDLFKGNTLCFTGLMASSVTLREKSAPHKKNRAGYSAGYSVEVCIKDFPYLLLWSAATEKLRFVCIEPWYTLPDFENASSEWESKKNLLRLESGKTFTAALTLTIHTV